MQRKTRVSFFCNTYGPTHYRDKLIFWENINLLSKILQGKDTILDGDFNANKSQVEKRGGSIVRDPLGEKMEDLMVDLDLLDPPLKNWKFTWRNKITVPSHIAARLDRFFYSSSFLQRDVIPTSLVLPSAAFDHKPIFLSLTHSEKLGPIPFSF